MRSYVVWSNGHLMGTVTAPSDMEAASLVVTMYGSETRMVRAAGAGPGEVYGATLIDDAVDCAGREAEILFAIGRDAQ